MARTAIPSLKAQLRAEMGSRASRRVRKQGLLPAVLYGHKESNVALSVDHDEIDVLLRHGARLVELDFDGSVERVLIKDIQYDYGGQDLVHIDFERVSMDERVTVSVVLDFHGTTEGALQGGVVDYHVTNIDVECLPMDIPDSIRVEIAHLEIGQTMHARDVVAPEGTKVVADPELIIVGVLAPKMGVEEEEEALEAAAAAEPEVIGEKKEEEETPEE